MSEELLHAFNTLTLEKKKEVEHFIYFLMNEQGLTQKNGVHDFSQLAWEANRNAGEMESDNMESTNKSDVISELFAFTKEHNRNSEGKGWTRDELYRY